MGLRKSIRRVINTIKRYNSNHREIELELERVSLYPAFKVGYTNVFSKPFKFHDSASFVATYKELFQDNLYKFKASKKTRTILDCGANMGLSVLYFSINYPDHHIIAFEPDPSIFEILEENVKTFQLKNVSLHNKAVWDKEGTLSFFTDNGMGGRVENSYMGRESRLIETVRLKDFISLEIDFLKIDIEGAEETVLKDCAEKLSDVNHIFFEYHNDIHKPQALHSLLQIVKEQGFHYYIKDSSTRTSPFIDNELICEAFDMAINVFCYKGVVR